MYIYSNVIKHGSPLRENENIPKLLIGLKRVRLKSSSHGIESGNDEIDFGTGVPLFF